MQAIRTVPDEQQIGVVVILGLFICGYCAFFFLGRSEKIRKRLLDRLGPRRGAIHHITFQKLLLLVFFGLIPLAVSLGALRLELREFCLYPLQQRLVLLITIFACAAALILSVLNPEHRRPDGLYPQIRVQVWTPALVAYNLLLWAVHLSAYEFMIRGLVLHVMLPFGMWAAVAVTTTLYAAIHIPRGPVETLGAIPLGAALCLLVLAAGTFWPAFFVHFSLSVGNTFGMILRPKPGMVFTTRRYFPDRSGAR